MIGYVTPGTNNFEASLKFYDGLFSCVGVKRLWQHGNMAAWDRSRAEPEFPFKGALASIGNGVMIALKMPNRKAVDTLNATCLVLGGTDEGPPGTRGDHGFYGGYFRDRDGNKMNAYVPA